MEHIVFDNRHEFETHFMHKDGVVPPLVEDWRKGRERDWVIADDEGIVQILRRKELPHPHDRKNYKLHDNGWCRTVVGTFIQDKNQQMDTDFDLHPNRYRFNGKTDKQVKQHARSRTTPTKRERIFSVAISTGKSLQRAYEEAYGQSNNWREKALELVKRETVMQEVRKTSLDVLAELGIDLKRVYRGIIDLAEGSDDDSVRFRALKELREAIEPKESKRMSLTGREIYGFNGFEGDPLKKIEATEVKVLAEGVTTDELPNVQELDDTEDQ